MNDDVPGQPRGTAELPPQPATTTDRPAAAASVAAGMLPAADIKSLRVFRATAKAAGGVLDLIMPMRVDGDGPLLFFAHPMIGLISEAKYSVPARS